MALLALGFVAVVGCGSTPPASSTPTPTRTTSSPSAARVRVDRELLAHLPPEVSGITVEFSAESSADAATAAGLAGADALAYAVAMDASTGDLVVATVVRPGAGFDDLAVRRLRETYAAAVCGPESGVRGNAEADLGGRPVHIATCAGGGHVYTARLEQSGTVVLAFSQGEGRLGEQLMARLRDR